MAYLEVGAWTPEHVTAWFRGLHTSLKTANMELILKNRVNGGKLFLLSAQDLIDYVPEIKVEALHSIVQGIQQLLFLTTRSRSETLQSLTLELACQARYLYNQIVRDERSPRLLPVSTTLTTPMTAGASKNRFDFTKVDSNMQINQSTKQRVSLGTLDSVSLIVDQILNIVTWLNATQLDSGLSSFNKDFKSIILRVAVELTSTAQRDQFVEQPNEFIKRTSKFLADYSEWVVLAIDDPEFIQPCWLDVVSIKKKPDEDDFGIVLQPATLNSLTIEEVVFSSPAHRSGRVSSGDEIVQIDYQTVVAWPLDQVKDLVKSYDSEIILTIKRKPSTSLNPSILVMKPYAIPLKKILPESQISNSDDNSIESTQRKIERQLSLMDDSDTNTDSVQEASELPKEPKGPVYPELQGNRPRRQLRRRMSISGSISDATVDLSVADSLPIPSLERVPAMDVPDKSRAGRVSKETLTKSVSHDTAKLYLHTLSIDRKYLWLLD